MIRVAHVVPNIENRASGPSYTVVELCRSLAQQGCETGLYVLDGVPPDFPLLVAKHVYQRWRFPHRLGVSPEMQRALRCDAQSWDLIHNNSLWMMPNIYAGDAASAGKTPLITSPHGTLSEWAWNRARWRKALIWWMGQGKAVEKTYCFHATAENEFNDIRSRGFRQPVAIISNGIDIPDIVNNQSKVNKIKRLLYAGRLHPVKGLVNLIRVWKKIANEFPEWELRLVGPDNNGHQADLEQLVRELDCPRVVFEGALFGQELTNAYQAASLYVLPTFSENFGITVAEALSNGVPALVTKGAPWSGLDRERCGWWIEVGEGPLERSLHEAMRMTDQERMGMGLLGRAWMKRDFGWDKIGGMMKQTYEWVLGGGPAPGWVEIR